MQLLDDWAAREAVQQLPCSLRRFPVSADVFMHRELRWKLAAYASNNNVNINLKLEDIVAQVEDLRLWR